MINSIFRSKIKNSAYILNINHQDLNNFFKNNYDNFKYFGGDMIELLVKLNIHNHLEHSHKI